ncbi:MAG: matrixin family metalloprotease [Rhizobiaceae bacterium]|nr:matrixin family metalloprotease [Rhizobiaceae bacterium]
MKWGTSQINGTTGGVVTWSFALGPGAFYSFDAQISLAAYQAAVRAAFDTWSKIADIEFVEVPDSAQSDIRLGWDTLDGPGNVRGEAAIGQTTGPGFFELSAEVCFDIEESWFPESKSEADLFYRVAVHEIGHVIGLEHSSDPNSIMYPVVSVGTLSAGDVSAAQAIYGIAPGAIPFVEADLELVASTYQFFTGSIPEENGFEYLIDSRDNPNDLNDPYYADFNQENRYINFSNNLGTQGAGADYYENTYGTLSFQDAVREVYDDIIGIELAVSLGINVDAALDFLVNAFDFYAQVAQERVIPGGVAMDDAVKIVMIGSVMNEAMKADVGVYADAVDDFVVAYNNGSEIPYGVDLFAI